MKKKKLIQQVLSVLFFSTMLVLSGCGTMPATPAAITQPANSYGIINSLDHHVAVSGGYILYGNVSWTDPLIPAYGANATLAGITDTNGKEIPFEYADVETYPAEDELRQYWAYKVNETNIAAPLRLIFAVTASLPVDGGSFTFDFGPNPQLGQKWDINQDVTVNNEIVHVLFAKQGGSESIGTLNFTMKSDSNIVGASIVDFANPPVGAAGHFKVGEFDDQIGQ